MHINSSRGWTLIEMLVILIILGILSAIAGPEIFKALRSENQVKTAAKNLIVDLKFAENEAIRSGGGDMTAGGVLASRSVFAIFSTSVNTYGVTAYTDANGNNTREAAPLDAITNLMTSKELANKVTFGTISAVNSIACTTTAGTPAASVSFAVDALTPCDGNPCVEFNANGFPKFTGTTSSGQIYLTNGSDAYAISMNAAGLMTLCKWDGTKWQITH